MTFRNLLMLGSFLGSSQAMAAGRCPSPGGAIDGPSHKHASWAGATNFPKERQVIQRDANNNGVVKVEVIATANTTCVEVVTAVVAGSSSMDDNAYVKPDLSIGYDWGKARDHFAATPKGWATAPANDAHLSWIGLQMHGARWKNVLFGQAGGNDSVWDAISFPAAP